MLDGRQGGWLRRTALAALLLPAMTTGQIDPDAGGIGICFDVGATVTSATVTVNPLVEIALHPSSGGWSLPVAVINGEAPAAVEPMAWGLVKSLFR